MILEKKTFEISNIKSVDELNSLSLALNAKEQVSHMKISSESIVFRCIDIDALLSLIQGMNKEFVVKEVVDGQKRQYDFAKRKETKHYFMFKNMLVEDDIYVLEDLLKKDERYKDVEYDKNNKILMLVSSQRDVLAHLRKELFKINPSIEIMEHRKPVRSQDVFHQKFLNRYLYIAVFLVIVSLAFITSKDHSRFTPVLWMMAMLLLAQPTLKKAWQNVKQLHFLKEEVLIVLAFVMGIVSGAYIETCLAVILYQAISPFLNTILDKVLRKIDRAVEMPEMGYRVEGDQINEVSLYDFEVNDILLVKSKGTIHIPGKIVKGSSQLSTYSNTSTYDLIDVSIGSQVHSGDVNVGDEDIHIQISESYESSNFIELMNIAAVAPVYESKTEKYTKLLSRLYTPVIVILAIILGVVLPIINFADYGALIHVGAVLLLISGSLSSDQAASLGGLSGFAKAFQNGIIVESSLGLDSINATQAIVYDRFDGVEVTSEELDLFKKLSHLGKSLVIFNDGPVALENDQYTIYNDLSVEEKLEKMDALFGPIVYIGDSFKDIALLQKSYVGISRGGLADPKVVESSDIVLIDSDLNKVYETFVIAKRMRTNAIVNNMITVCMKIVIMIALATFFALPLWLVVLIEMLVSGFVMIHSTHILKG